MDEIKPGDVVQLKSGGPYMTVGVIESDDHLWCEWFEGDKHHSRSFKISSLIKVEQDE